MTPIGIVQLVLVLVALIIAVSHAGSPPRALAPLWMAVTLLALALLVGLVRI